MEKQTRGLKAWVRRITEMDMPALAGVIKELKRLTEDNTSDAEQLAKVILKDASITSQVLRVANSVQYNPAAQGITTISRAAVTVGYTEIKNICLTVAVIDTLLGKNPRHRLLEIIARSFHAAVQAKNIAAHLPREQKEEVFIAALLYHLGEMAFLGCGGQQADEYDRLMSLGEDDQRSICLDVMGVGVKSITKGLAVEWDISGLLQDSLSPTKSPPPAIRAVLLGEYIARSANQGIKSKPMEKLIIQTAKFTGKTEQEAKEMIIASADEAAVVADTYGASKVCHLIPDAQTLSKGEEVISGSALQLQILHQLTDMAMNDSDVNRVFQLVLKGLHQGVELSRCAIALLDAHRVKLEARYVAGDKTWREDFRFPVQLKGPGADLFSQCMTTQQVMWLGGKHMDEGLYSRSLQRLLPKPHALVAPIAIGKRVIGVIYGDEGGRPIEEKSFQEFDLFAKQINMVLSLMLAKK